MGLLGILVATSFSTCWCSGVLEGSMSVAAILRVSLACTSECRRCYTEKISTFELSAKWPFSPTSRLMIEDKSI